MPHTLRARAGLCALLLLAAAPAAAQQRGPVQLFPGLAGQEPEPRAPVAPPEPQDQRPPATVVGPQDRAPPASAFEPRATGVVPPPAAVQVEGLAAPSVDDIGVVGRGLEPGLWVSSEPAVVATLVENLPLALENPPLRDLAVRLLLTGSSVPGGEPGRLLAARVERLLAMGALDEAQALLDQLPRSDADTALNRLAAEAALWAGDHERACQLAQDIGIASEAPFWAKLLAFCGLRGDDPATARLGLDLVRETGGGDDPAFFALADLVLAGDQEAALPPLDQASALHLALLREAGRALPPSVLAQPSPALAAALARTPALAGDQALAFAEYGLLTGAVGADELRRRYAEAAVPDEDPRALAESAWGPDARAALWQALEALDPQAVRERAELLDVAWQAARGAERFLVARAFEPAFAGLPVQAELAFAGPSVARALLAAQQPVEAARWFSLLRQRGQSDADGAPGAAAAPLFALAGVGGSAAVPEPDAPMLAAWRASAPDAAGEARTLYALLEGAVEPVPQEAWWALLDGDLRESAELPATPLWRSLARATVDRRAGELVLLGLHMLGGAPALAHPEAVVAGLQALRDAGLEREARAIATASALHEGL